MPTGSYEGVVDEGVGSGCLVCGEGERDICCGRPLDNTRSGCNVENLYSGVISAVDRFHGLPSSLWLSFFPQSPQDLSKER